MTVAPTEGPKAIYDALKRGEVMLVDVREPSEHAEERIDGAMLAPLSRFDPAKLPRDRSIVLHCKSGKRSEDALKRCAKAGVPVRAHMSGGIVAWKAAGLPTLSGGAISGRK